MAAPAFNKKVLVNEKLIPASLAGSPLTSDLYDFAAEATDRFFRVRLEWLVRNDSDLSQGRTGGRHCLVRWPGSGTMSIIAQAALETDAAAGAGGTFVFAVSGSKVQVTFSNDAGVTGEIEYILSIYS
jgi:hypothetical protein